MVLPETNVLNFFNKVLISLKTLSPTDEPCEIDSLIKHCKSFSLGGTMGEYEYIISQCQFCGLVSVKEHNVMLSVLGNKFINANSEHYFEITDSQKNLMAEKIVFKGPWSHYARELFRFFSVNQTTSTYELSLIDKPLPKAYNAVVHLFKYLGILQENEYFVFVDRKYSELVFRLTSDSKTITEQQLEKMLMENRKLGAQAEIAVVEFEKKRLNKLGKPMQAELVKRISTINVAAGYDVESFDGSTNDIFPNRYIEVKATQGDEIRFYMTMNEMKVAKIKKSTYWIYMMKSFDESKSNECLPIMIQDPGHHIDSCDYLVLESHTFLIKEAADVMFNEYSIEELKWLQLI